MQKENVVLIDFGDLPSLACLSMYARRSEIRLWHPLVDTPASRMRTMQVRAHKEMFGCIDLVEVPFTPSPGQDQPCIQHLDQTRLIQMALSELVHHSTGTLVWPCHVGPVVDQVERVVEKAFLLQQVAVLDAGFDPMDDALGIRIRTPVMDLEDVALLDLGMVNGMPLDAFWPCQHGQETPCNLCSGCQQWQQAFQARQLDWPWAMAPADDQVGNPA